MADEMRMFRPQVYTGSRGFLFRAVLRMMSKWRGFKIASSRWLGALLSRKGNALLSYAARREDNAYDGLHGEAISVPHGKSYVVRYLSGAGKSKKDILHP